MTTAELLPIAHAALDVARKMIAHPPTHIRQKGDRDLVTDRDLAIEAAVKALLSRETPDFEFLGEEQPHSLSADKPTWVLDPIDGTSNWVRDIPLCGVSLALIKDDETLLGAIDLPFFGTRCHALRDGGAYSGHKQLQVSGANELANSMVSLGDYATVGDIERHNRELLHLTEALAATAERVRMLGTAAADLAWLASGKLDATVMLSNLPWDTAAGVLLAREAGATVLDRTGAPHTLRSSAVIAAATPELASAIHHLMLVGQHDTAPNQGTPQR